MKKATELVFTLAAAVAIFLLYLPASSGALYYDDYSNLEGLANISSWSDAWKFVFSGHAGPLGRPLALLTFVPFAAAWPDNASSLLLFNIVLHCANFLLLLTLGRLLVARVGDIDAAAHFKIALGAAFMWAVMPLLASTSLIAIQRMTGLASFFGLLGLLGFVRGYLVAERRPMLGLLVQLASLGCGTLLAIFSKESGAVIPVFALVIDLLFLRKPEGVRAQRVAVVRRVILACPLLFIVYYISPAHTQWWQFSEYRGFSPYQRFMTEQVVMWEYVWRAFFPQSPRAFGPFHDYYGIRDIGRATILAGVAWFAVLVAALFLRRRFIWFSFAVLWFLAGHLIESTSVLLELYFEHRNYLAVYGACLFLSAMAFTVRGRIGAYVPYLFAGYVALLSAILLAITILWGQPGKAADSWNVSHPGSARAALHAVFVETSKDLVARADSNNDYIARERRAFSLKVLDRTKGACPDCLDVRLQGLMYSCSLTSAQDTSDRLVEALNVAELGRINVTVVDQLFNIQELLRAEECPPLTYRDLLELIDRLRASRKMDVQVYGAKIYFVRAIAAQQMGLNDEVIYSLAEAEKIAPEAMPVLQYQVYYAIEQGRFSEAEHAISRRMENEKVRAQLPLQQMEDLRKAVSEAGQETKN